VNAAAAASLAVLKASFVKVFLVPHAVPSRIAVGVAASNVVLRKVAASLILKIKKAVQMNTEFAQTTAAIIPSAIPNNHDQRPTAVVVICHNAGKASSVKSFRALPVDQKLTVVAAAVNVESRSREAVTIMTAEVDQMTMRDGLKSKGGYYSYST
jgi:archaellum component FlaG (FlaF/FlaG flagellin family)